ncbi:MAG: YabP/YqfC family sporulation protein [Oscillospiraceae bacterium]
MQQALMEAKSVEQPHRLTLDSRSRLSVTGVLEVESFDETEILLTSTRGPLSIRGQGLRLQQLSIDGGQVLVDGSVDAIVMRTTAARQLLRKALRLMEIPVSQQAPDLRAGDAARPRAVRVL